MGIFHRGNKLYLRVRNEIGTWENVATGLSVGSEVEAKRMLRAYEKRAQAARRPDEMSVSVYAEAWIEKRRKLQVGSVDDDETRLRLHALPRIGHLRLSDVRPKHIKDLVEALRMEAKLAPRSIRHVYATLAVMFKSARIDELVEVSPCVLEKGTLPGVEDADPMWRSTAIFTRSEVERLISDDRILPDRRVVYALKFLAGLRHGEVAALRWRHWDRVVEPLGRLTVEAAWDSKGKREKATKTKAVRQVPVHPVLAKVLAEWRLSGWPMIYGKAAKDDDLVCPTRSGAHRNNYDAQEGFLHDCELIDIRTRRGHDLRRTFISLAQADGGSRDVLRLITHTPPQGVMDLYTTLPWPTLCAAVAGLRVELRTPLVTDGVSARETRRGRWANSLQSRCRGSKGTQSEGKMATPAGFEGGSSDTIMRVLALVPDGARETVTFSRSATPEFTAANFAAMALAALESGDVAEATRILRLALPAQEAAQ